MMFSVSDAAARATSARAASTAASSRSAFHCSSASIRSRSTSGSGFMMPPSELAVSGESSVSV
jgi:hypothetical protein